MMVRCDGREKSKRFAARVFGFLAFEEEDKKDA
jgi:hypothetical protein